ncbi:hypothetical protein MR857_13235 [bacterium]|nr:hypothetical protein [bacterium]MDY3022370.1 hypothetical protein [Oliverpabstia sp.]
MEPQTELMLNIKGIVKQNLDMDLNLSELPKDGGLYAELGPVMEKGYIRGPGLLTVPVLFMCKHTDEAYCLNELSKVSNYFSRNHRLPNGESYQFRGLKVASGPHKTGRTEDGQIVYSCIVNIQISF